MSTANVGRFVWHEHMTKDVKAAIAFYTEVVGWKTEPFGDTYTMWVGTHGPMGGVMVLGEAEKMGVPPHWYGSVEVSDVDATVALATERGGKALVKAMDIPNVGRYAVLADPQGGAFGIYKPLQAMTLPDTPGPGDFCWNELMTSDQAAAFKFYGEVLGWKKLDAMDMGPMGSYLIFGVGERRLGGMMNIPPGMQMPTAWNHYIEVADLDAAAARAEKMGAKTLNKMDVPGGRIVQMTDPQGAFFALHHAAKPA
jgi:predicted enzyme related to lactoylglutathione lyase